jgi:PD-(D/E)XK nuclease superfamily protein
VLSTDQKGAIAETAVIHAAVKLVIDGYQPVVDGTRCDLILDLGRRLTRVQCKWAARTGDVLVIRCYRCRRTKDGLLKRGYTADEIDAFAAYCLDLDQCYFFPLEAFGGRTTIQLRLAPSRNNQQVGINWAEAYEFDATLAQFGAVAQLGERLAGSQ